MSSFMNINIHHVPVAEFLKKMPLMDNVYQGKSRDYHLAGEIRIGDVQINVYSEHSKTQILPEDVIGKVENE